MTVALGNLVKINPSTPEFDEIDDDALITFMPLEACWPDGRADVTRKARRGDVAVGYTRFRRGDVLLPKITPTFEAGRVFPVVSPTRVGAGTTELHVMRVLPGVDSRYISYVCRSQPFLSEGQASLQGVGNLRRIPVDFLRRFPVWISDGQQQVAISSYLDRETVRIDALIEKQENLIGTLRERRSAVVETHVSPSSGPLKSLGSLMLGGVTSGVDFSADEGEPGWLRYVRTTDISGMTSLHAGGIRRITPDQAGRSRIRRDDLLFTRSGSLGTNYLHESDEEMAFAGYLVRVRPRMDRCVPRYIAWWSQSRHHLDQIALGASRSTIDNFSGSKFRAMKVPVPPLAEQRKIVQCLDGETGRIDALIAKAEQFIVLAKERRAALITAAVTGQIDVRGAA